MSFPDDYKRVQQPGGAAGVVAATVYLARQLAINITDWTVLVGDGSTPGGHRVLMEENFNAFMQGNAPFGTKAYIEAGTDGLPTELARLWKASELALTFAKIADTTNPSVWFVKDDAMPDVQRIYAKSIGDANNALATGQYRFDPATAVNLPAGIPATGPQHVMLVIAHSAQNTGQILYIRDGTGRIFIRSQTDGVWQAWVQATGLTMTDLNTRVAKAGDTMTGKLNFASGTNPRASLNVPDGVPPGTPVDGDVWRQDSAGGLMFRKGAASKRLKDQQNDARAYLREEKAQGASGGNAVTTTWTNRIINTEVYDPESIVTLASNQFTLAYDCWCEVTSPFYACSTVIIRIFNVTDGVTAATSPPVYMGDVAIPNQNGAILTCRGLLIGGKTYRVDYYLSNTGGSAQALGVNQPFGAGVTPAVFTEVVLERV